MSGTKRAAQAAAALFAFPLAALGIAIAAAATGSQNPSVQPTSCGAPAADGPSSSSTASSGAGSSSAARSAGGSSGRASTKSALTTAGTATLSSSQTANARIIYSVSADDGLPAQAAVIAIATAMQESDLEDLPYGDRDSLGLFQQRPSQGWGTPAQIMQPVYAAQQFYAHLAAIPAWQSLPVTVAAQAVQHSAYPNAYAQWQPLAAALVSQFTGHHQINCAPTPAATPR